MSRLVQKIKDLGSKAADSAKKSVQKYFPPETLAFAVNMVDNQTLRKAAESTKKVLREIRANKLDKVDEVLKVVTRKLDDVLRSTDNALRDMSDLAGDSDKIVNPTEQSAATRKFQTYKTQCDNLLDSGDRIVSTIKQKYSDLKDQKLQSLLRTLQARSRKIDKAFNRVGKVLNGLGGKGEGAEAEEAG